jgi:phenylacetic acid degradation operon negative regulatory protein
MKLIYAEVLDLFLWTMDSLTRPTFSNLLAGYEEYSHRPMNRNLLLELERQRFLEQTGRVGKDPVYRITAAGIERTRIVNPHAEWGRTWDGVWRVVTFDLPEVRRKDRQLLWRALRARKLGLLQRSVWIWPHPLQAILEEIVQVEGVPECFCGFGANDLFLCTHAEVVASAWDWEEIGLAHRSYLQQPSLEERQIAAARDLGRLAALARSERRSYAYAFALDPQLPRGLWPKSYQGAAVQRRHERLRHLLAEQFAALSKGGRTDS